MFTSLTGGFDSLFGLDSFGKSPPHHTQTPANSRLSPETDSFLDTPPTPSHSVTYNYPDTEGIPCFLKKNFRNPVFSFSKSFLSNEVTKTGV